MHKTFHDNLQIKQKNPNCLEQHATWGTTERLCTVLSEKTWNFDRRQTQKWKIRCRYEWRLSVKTKNFFNLQAKKDPGLHAKWNCWDQFWPGVAPCEGLLETIYAKLAETSIRFFHSRLKSCHFSPNFYRKNHLYTSADAKQSAEQNMSPTARRYEQPNLRYLPSNSKISQFCPTGTEICIFDQQSCRFRQNVSRTKFLQYVQEAVCQFSAKSVGNFPKSSKFTPQLPSINAPPFFL